MGKSSDFYYNSNTENWDFETANLKGSFQPEGEKNGLKSLIHKSTGVDVVHSKYNWSLNLFMLFSNNLCMGQARLIDRTFQVERDKISISYSPVDNSSSQDSNLFTVNHKVALNVIYQFKEPNIVDIEITADFKWPYPGYEVFLSNYFNPAMSPFVYVSGSPFDEPPDQPKWISPDSNDVFLGTGLVFSRDQHAAKKSIDGRWDRIWGLYQWNPQRYYALPMIAQVDIKHNLAAIIMSHPTDCFSVTSGYSSLNPKDPFSDQNPMYMSFFGDDMLPGDVKTVKARMVVDTINTSLDDLSTGAYKDFLNEYYPGHGGIDRYIRSTTLGKK